MKVYNYPDPENPPIAMVEGLSKSELKVLKKKLRMDQVI